MSISNYRIALVGNPNTGKTSLFNALTGLNQRVGNYPGITIDKKIGFFNLNNDKKVEVIDLPGTYSLSPNSPDEEVVLRVLTSKNESEMPEAVIFVVDASNLKRNLYFFSQIKDMGIPVVVALNMVDIIERRGMSIDINMLSLELGVPVLPISARKSIGLDELKKTLENIPKTTTKNTVDLKPIAPEFTTSLMQLLNEDNCYVAWIKSIQTEPLTFLSDNERLTINNTIKEHNVDVSKLKIKETIKRYQYVNDVIKKTLKYNKTKDKTFSTKIDNITTHKVYGMIVFMTLMFVLFQAIYSWASIPMDIIEYGFSELSIFTRNILPDGPLNSLISDGVIPGLGGVMVFVPQIAILFTFISMMEDSGYMSRVIFLMDKLMRNLGMSGKSVVSLMSGMACAVPAIMSTRTIDDWRERLITIFVTPLITCSARLPVYTMIIALVIPDEKVFGFFNLQGIVLMGMYLLGFLSAIITAYVMNKLLKVKSWSSLIIEMPSYKMPYYKNVGLDVIEKTKSFIVDAGKIIIAVSVILWFSASYGSGDKLENASEIVKTNHPELTDVKLKEAVASYKLENSYIGDFGHFIEPVLEPIGFDWKIGIALITSLAAREVFVGTMATIYSVDGGGSEGLSLVEKMKQVKNPETGKPLYNLAVGLSLLMFYAFSMQCMTTIATVYKETNGIKWPIIQTVYMTALAYITSFIVYSYLK
ncbi:MAG: ferrous iron transport protein B [Ichthyobacteriaceae bacterium]|nr:ferrous iron transport protein B [Ichthyobacteriaceae bacterium]